MSLKILYTTSATATGGRNGHTQNHDGVVSVDTSIPKSMGGPGRPGATTPEDLFACGYAACFGSACDFAAKSILKLSPTGIVIDCKVGIGTHPIDGRVCAHRRHHGTHQRTVPVGSDDLGGQGPRDMPVFECNSQ
jgi:lipoyl-dependent peroxiredoxin